MLLHVPMSRMDAVVGAEGWPWALSEILLDAPNEDEPSFGLLEASSETGESSLPAVAPSNPGEETPRLESCAPVEFIDENCEHKDNATTRVGKLAVQICWTEVIEVFIPINIKTVLRLQLSCKEHAIRPPRKASQELQFL